MILKFKNISSLILALLICGNVKSQKRLTCDFLSDNNTIGQVTNFWDIRNIVSDRLEKDIREGEIINSIRLLGGWKTDTTGGVDAYKWDGQNYVYDFDVLLARINRIKAHNDIYQIVLDNPPWAFQRGIEFVDEPDGIHYLSEDKLAQYGNAIPVNDKTAWVNFIKATVNKLVETYGESTVLKWRIRIGSEIDTQPQHWAGTKDEFFEHYKITVEAVKEVLPEAKVGTHFRQADHTSDKVNYKGEPVESWGPDFISWAADNNIPYDFIGVSMYPFYNREKSIDMESVYEHGLAPIANHTQWNPKATFGIHEFWLLSNAPKNKKKFPDSRWLENGSLHGAAYFASLANMCYKKNIEKVHRWSSSNVAGVLSPSDMTKKVLETMFGESIYAHTSEGFEKDSSNIADAIFTKDIAMNTYSVLVYVNTPKKNGNTPEDITLNLKLPFVSSGHYTYRTIPYQKDQSGFDQIRKDFPEYAKQEKNGGLVSNDLDPNGALGRIFPSNGFNANRTRLFEIAKDYLDYNNLKPTKWQDVDTVTQEGKTSLFQIKLMNIPSPSLMKIEVKTAR